MQRKSQEPPFAAGRDQVADVEERRGRNDAVAHDADHAALLDDEELAGPFARRDDVDGRRESACEELRRDGQRGMRRGRREGRGDQ